MSYTYFHHPQQQLMNQISHLSIQFAEIKRDNECDDMLHSCNHAYVGQLKRSLSILIGAANMIESTSPSSFSSTASDLKSRNKPSLKRMSCDDNYAEESSTCNTNDDDDDDASEYSYAAAASTNAATRTTACKKYLLPNEDDDVNAGATFSKSSSKNLKKKKGSSSNSHATTSSNINTPEAHDSPALNKISSIASMKSIEGKREEWKNMNPQEKQLYIRAALNAAQDGAQSARQIAISMGIPYTVLQRVRNGKVPLNRVGVSFCFHSLF